MDNAFPPNQDAAQSRLLAFLPHAGWGYARNRNFDSPRATARLSPYIRHRIITEHEVVSGVLSHHSADAAEKFIQEVFWRSYWKGWLELRPAVWLDYQIELQAALNRVQTESGLRTAFQTACLGQTRIACFDHWAQELSQTGFLHNHARMWFASIWIFTLRLPWTLGADLFLRSLLDGDAASNTLSWRWVAGLQTQGKNYLATAQNIQRFTEGRFNPVGELNETAAPLEGAPPPERGPLPLPRPPKPGLKTGTLLHDEDLSLTLKNGPIATLNASAARTPLQPSPMVTHFTDAVLADTASDATRCHSAQDIADWAARQGLEQMILPYAPTGPVSDTLAKLRQVAPNLHIAEIRADWDSTCWPHATAGFFKFRKKTPNLIDTLIKQKA